MVQGAAKVLTFSTILDEKTPFQRFGQCQDFCRPLYGKICFSGKSELIRFSLENQIFLKNRQNISSKKNKINKKQLPDLGPFIFGLIHFISGLYVKCLIPRIKVG